MTHPAVDAIRAQLAVAADPDRAPVMRAYMKSTMPYYGVAMPDVRRIASACFRDHPSRKQARATWESTIRASSTRPPVGKSATPPSSCSVSAAMRHRDQTDLELLVDSITPAMSDPEFFLRKAFGWALREYAKTDAAWTRHFVAAHQDQLSGLSRREALKHLAR